jgi:hypothetical protein
MAGSSSSGYRGPMIHIRLDEKTHKQLRILVAHRDTTIQQLVNDLVQREVGRSSKQKKQKKV